jgi:hypothetical protein
MLQPPARNAGGITSMKQAVKMTAYGKPGNDTTVFRPFHNSVKSKTISHYHRHDEY